jgi:hypothetical protein
MAKIQEELVVIRLSKLIKSTDDDTESLTNKDFSVNLEAIVQELVGETVVVEIEKE